MRPARRLAAGLALALAAAAPASAQDVQVRLEPRLVPVGGIAELVVEVDPGGVTGGVDEPALPPMPKEVAIVGRARESRVSMSGLDVERRTVFRYTLRGLEAGTARIDPIAVRVGGQVRTTAPLVLLVVADEARRADAAAAGRAPPIFVSARVDRPRAWVGQQVTLTFSFYHDPAAPLAESPDYDPPETPGFWRVELSDEPEISSERIGERVYQVQRFRYALFPLHAGSAEIGPARVRVVHPDVERWWEPGRPRVLETDPLVVTVDELPAGAPAGFGGAVGRYDLSGGVPQRSVAAGSPVELALTVRGTGNPATVSAPAIPDWPGIEVGAPSVETESEGSGSRLGGRSTFRWILVPRSEGRLDLGSARLPYFDPELGTYAVDTLSLGELSVLPGSGLAAAPVGSPREPTLWAPRAPRTPWPRGLAGEPLYWAALAGPWLAWLGLLAWRRRGREAPGDRRRADSILAAARDDVEARGAEAAPAAARAVERALEAATGISLAGLSPRERRARLERAGADAALAEAAEDARAALDGARFGGVEPEVAAAALARLERELAVERRPKTQPSAAPLLVLALLVLPAAVRAQGPATESVGADWAAANAAYEAGDYAAAARAFDALAERTSDPRIEANRAAALWRDGRRGEALARYHAALALAPREGRIRADASRLWLELGRPPRPGPLARALGWVRLDELLLFLLVAGTAACGAVALARGRPRLRPAALAAVGIALLAAGSAGLHAWTIARPDRAVATAGAELRAAPGGEPIATLPEGAVVRVLEREADGWRVDPEGQPAGWVAPDRIVPLD